VLTLLVLSLGKSRGGGGGIKLLTVNSEVLKKKISHYLSYYHEIMSDAVQNPLIPCKGFEPVTAYVYYSVSFILRRLTGTNNNFR
jgi:hypothetical protein